MKKLLFNVFTILIPAIILFAFLFLGNNSINIIQVLKDSKIRWIICAVLCMILYWLFESISLHIVSAKLSDKLDFKNAIRTSMIGQLFNCITPFSTGGQPVQAYCMVKCGVTIGQASSILLAKFIIYQIVLTLYSLVALVLRFNFFANKISDFGYLVFVGFIVNFIVVVCLICIGFFPNIATRFLIWCINVLDRFNLIKNKEDRIKKINAEMNGFYESFQFLKQNLSTIFKSSLIIILQLTVFFVIPYFICLSLGVINIDLLTIISAGAFVLMITSFVPLPGGSGGAETGFYLFFGMFFPQTGVIAIAILIWRIVTFYIPILVGMLFSNVGKFKVSLN